MAIFMLWIHLLAAIVSVGGICFLFLFLTPALRSLNLEQRLAISRAVTARFRWAIWSAIALLLISGFYHIRQSYWEVAWGKSWWFLTAKIALSFLMFGILLGLTLPLKFFDRWRARSRAWLIVAFCLATGVILIAAYLRRG